MKSRAYSSCIAVIVITVELESDAAPNDAADCDAPRDGEDVDVTEAVDNVSQSSTEYGSKADDGDASQLPSDVDEKDADIDEQVPMMAAVSPVTGRRPLARPAADSDMQHATCASISGKKSLYGSQYFRDAVAGSAGSSRE